MASSIQPVPQWAPPFEGDKEAMELLKVRFNPVWLKWFIDTISQITDGSLIDHDTLAGLQGGAAGQYYHLNSALNTLLTSLTDVRLLGRSAGSSGPTQAITVGTGLTLAAGALSSSITQYTDEMAEDAVGGILTDTASIDFTYNDAANTITADVKSSFATSGTYTPTLTNSVNISASTVYPLQYLRVGSTVTVGGIVDVDPIAAGDTQLFISLPIASALTQVYQLGGSAAAYAVAGLSAAIYAEITNDVALMRWTAVDTTNRTFAFSFTYQVI